ncbi:molybdopterin-guanine dinucleotide biosynthesis protein A [Micromonospora sicca]|uniref:Molybdopterin-guanine dinucleotide biosynthesis protein A n=1 Tax=Micromonospora sicca TaxID=2202420 RepID=A0A317DFX3_9ACTN|nr:NTP transferase domain-containing protein [Micromonospora sp. 4G51]PWR13648.1 molybdopterin-guanine dinucleotide biosynthesis protein A [Micromonospora sp. 4G51]
MRLAGLVLAAGAGRRFGMPKALVRHHGRLLVERAIEVAVAAGCAPVVVVLGAAAADIRAVAELGAAVVVDNPDWESGMGSSLRAGLAALAATDASAAVVLLVDMPGVTAAAARRVGSLADADALAMAGYGERRGHPVLLGRSHWTGIARTAIGDVGARPYLRRHAAEVQVVSCVDVADDGDIDIPADIREA